MSSQLWTDAANTVVNAGQIPIPISGTLIELLQTIMTEEQAGFIQIFTKPMRMDEIRQVSPLDECSIETILNELMNKGVVTGIPGRSSGIVIYRLMPPLPGLFEYTLMRGITGDKEKKLAALFDKLFNELTDLVQGSYDDVVGLLKTVPPVTRVVPIEADITQKADNTLPYDDVKQIIDKFETIAVAHCYCRHEKDLLGKPCKVTDDRENCLLFGQTAKFVIDYQFGKQISKQEALDILDKAEKDGLVHKSFHERQDIEKDEFAICNCCKCCCGTFDLYYRGGAPAHTYASYIATVIDDECTGCGTCADICPMEAIALTSEIAEIDEIKCIGCGVCAYHCPTEAIRLDRTGNREVFVAPLKKASNIIY